MIVSVEKLDHNGKGIAHIDGKVVFVESALPGEKVEIEITRDQEKFSEARVLKYIKKSSDRIEDTCPYASVCGGCALRSVDYEYTLNYKSDKVKEILSKYAHIDCDIDIIKNDKPDNYRNKIELHVHNGVIGFYKKNTHKVIEIDECKNTEDAINQILSNVKYLGVKEGTIVIKCNYNRELLISIDSKSEVNVDIDKFIDNNRVVGIVLNGRTIYGSDNFIECIDEMYFKESYNSFFQVNRVINKKLFQIIRNNILDNDIVLDLCCGVGTLSIVASEKANRVYGIEIVPNAIKDALINAKMNKRDNVKFILGDAFNSIDKINDSINTFIIDPPRNGLSIRAIKSILNSDANKLIYVSCNPITLARDLKLLKEKYDVKSVNILDMFSYTEHVESVVILEKIK